VNSQSLLTGDLTWDQLVDGRPHRLKRGKHFRGAVREVQHEAQVVADREGRGLLAVRDLLGNKNQYLWVQFADQELLAGQPCRCGGRELLRRHERLAHCAACGRTAVLEPTSAQAGAARPLGRHLSDYEDLELVAQDPTSTSETLERWYGRARDPAGWIVLVEVDFPLVDGKRVPDPENPGADLHRLRRWPVRPFAAASDLGLFDGWPDPESLRSEET
jgi:hypothetical protein